jgi:hypothetical protein
MFLCRIVILIWYGTVNCGGVGTGKWIQIDGFDFASMSSQWFAPKVASGKYLDTGCIGTVPQYSRYAHWRHFYSRKPKFFRRRN